MTFRTDTATAPPENAVVDIAEMMHQASTMLYARSGSYFGGTAAGLGIVNGALPASFHVVNAGTVDTNTAFEGRTWWAMTSAAAATNGRQGIAGLLPMGEDTSGDPASSARPLRYILEGLMMRTAPIVAATGFGYGFRRTNVLQFFSTTPGIALESITTVNGGNWSINMVKVNAGLLTTLDTGIPGTTRIFFRWVLDRTTNPLLTLLVNGATVFSALGVLNMPHIVGGEALFNGFFQGNAALAGVGQIDRVTQVRYRVETLPGYQ